MTSKKMGLMGLLLITLMPFAAPVAAQGSPRTPVVIFPAFHFTRLEVTVNNQSAFPECPASGTFEDWFDNDNPGTAFSQVCKDKLLTLVYDPDPGKPMAERFSNQPGVTVAIKEFGTTESAPFYEDLYVALEGAGYVRNQDIRVAGYDSRLTPDMDGFLARTVALIEATYAANGNTPVHLVGHSNGPLYAQYLLTHTTQAWKNQYIHGFTPLAGNWPGQGLLYSVFFAGLNIINFGFPADPENAASSARMYETHPSSYMSSSDPAVFGDQEVVIRTLKNGPRDYTPQDNLELFQDAGLTLAAELAPHYTGFVKFADPASFPNVDVYAEKGSGLATIVGVRLLDLTVGRVLNLKNPQNLFFRDGDANQEDITNDAIQVWENMSCFRFELTDNPGIDHFTLAGHPDVMQRLLANLQRPRSVCP
jgi:lecithin-cholesterol acyltransferase